MTVHETPARDVTTDLAGVSAWMIRQGLEGTPFETVLEEWCVRMVDAGIPLQRAHITMRALHPEIGSIAFRWHREQGNEKLQFERSDTAPEDWLQSPLYHLLAHDIIELRQRLNDPNPALEFPFFEDLRAQGATDYFASKIFFFKTKNSLAVDPLNSPEGMVISLTTDAPDGFSEDHLKGIREILPTLGLTLKCGANRRMAEDITATYLGRDAGTRVLSGEIYRGSFETIPAVIWYFDLRGFTKMSEVLAGPDIIEMLNDYFGEVVAIVEQCGGNVLKFIGDGMLAIFDLNANHDARAVAIDAACRLREAFAAVNARRGAADLPVTGFTLGLHVGDVFYGNIGGKERLDFTVIGPAVNTTARILGMCSLVDLDIVISSSVARPVLDGHAELVSLGQYRLRGVSERQELFTLD